MFNKKWLFFQEALFQDCQNNPGKPNNIFLCGGENLPRFTRDTDKERNVTITEKLCEIKYYNYYISLHVAGANKYGTQGQVHTV